jgi:hypothetical protein
VIRFTPEIENGLPIVEALGELRTGMSGGLTSTVIELLYDEVGAVGSYAAVGGWLVRTPLHPCASFSVPSDAPSDLPTYGCPEADYLTDAEFQPVRPDGSTGPAKGILLPIESYAKWAPNPAVLSSGVQPRRATFLLQLVHESACGPTDDCLAGPLIRRWQIAARLEPIPELNAAPMPSASTMDPVAPSSGDAWTVARLVSLPVRTSPADFLVRGYLVASPPLRCYRAEPVPSGLPDYGCGEFDWLTDDPFQPWVADGITGSTRQPPVGIRVQNGAYQAFAPDPSPGQFGAREPRLGTYVVRFGVRSSCDYAIRSPDTTCLGGPSFTWEVVGRLP